MSNKNKLPRCPTCGSKSEQAKGGLFRCLGDCLGGLFDRNPAEGGTHGTRPDQRILREEREQQQLARRS